MEHRGIQLFTVPVFRLPERISRWPGMLWMNTRLVGTMLSRAIKRIRSQTPTPLFNGAIAHGNRYTGLSVPMWHHHVHGTTCIVVHGVDPFMSTVQDRRESKRLFHQAGEKSDRVIVVGNSLRAYAQDIGFSPSKVHVVANGTDIPEVTTQMRSQRSGDEIRRIVSVSHLVPLKGIADNLQALGTIAAERPELRWEYRIIGVGPQQSVLEGLTQTLMIADRVKFLGRLSYSKTMSEIEQADIFSLPSWKEAFGIVYLEAMARMKPTIGCIDNGAADIIAHEVDGFLVPPQSPSVLAGTLVTLITSPEICETVGTRARETAQNFTWDANAAKMLRVLQIRER